MGSPRGILLWLSGLIGFGGAYFAYSRVLGSVDGLPTLPARYLAAAEGEARPQVEYMSATDAKLIEAFGPDCPEKSYTSYPTKIHKPDDGLVIATGRPQWGEGPSPYVTLAPFSLAMYGKARPNAAAGEVTEVSTVHADRAVLEFDRPVGSEKDVTSGKAKLIGMELRSDPTPYATDRRNGRVVITNNQRSADPNKSLVFKTPGPVFYRASDPAKPTDAAPNVWTTAAVQIENRENMPRPLRGVPLPAVPAADDAPGGGVVADMLLGSHTPPPTVTAEGMKIYLKPPPQDPPTQPGAPKKRGSSFGGVKKIELSENVLMSLWVDGKGGFPGSNDDAAAKPKAAAPTDPPAAAGAFLGGLADAGVLADRLNKKSLVRIRTLGPFRYDYDTNTARYDVAPQPNPLLPNHVEVTRLAATGGRDYLVCQALELEFDRPLTQGGANPGPPGDRPAGPAFKAVRATGPNVYLSAQAEGFEATGTALVYGSGSAVENGKPVRFTQTVLQGAPLVAIRQKNKLEAGKAGTPAQLTITSREPAAGSGKPKTQETVVRGPGAVDLFDSATNATTLRAVWGERLDHRKETVGGRDLDLFVFAGNGAFLDPTGKFDLTADTLRLWLDGANDQAQGTQPRPFRLQGVGNVRGKSADATIRDAEQLNIWFKDVAPPPAPKAVAAAAPAAGPPQPVAPTPAVAAAAPAPPPKQPNPLHLSSRTVEIWVRRYPDATVAPAPGKQPAVKYEMEEARCADRVVVTQAPADAKKGGGTNITGATLNLTRQPAGHAMTVTGTESLLAEVHFDGTKIAGPTVVIDQPNNSVSVTGKGWLQIPSGNDLSGAALSKPADLTIVWADKMRFFGERRTAWFEGQVQAEQRTASPATADREETWGRSFTVCHRLDVTFDRPVYFNQLKPKDEAAKPKDTGPKIEYVVCSPVSEDGDGGKPRTSSPVLFGDDTYGAKSGKHLKASRVSAKLIEVKVEEARTLVTAAGPGESRTLDKGRADMAPVPPGPTAPGQPQTKASPEEMKLTVVRFAGKLRVKDQKGILQQAIFEDNVRVLHLPSENLAERVEEHNTPPRSVYLTCTDTLTVTGYRGPNGSDGEKKMEAVGDARVRDDQYLGVGHKVTFDGAVMTLAGYGDGQAQLHRRQRAYDGQDSVSGREIQYDTRNGRQKVTESSGGAFTTGR